MIKIIFMSLSMNLRSHYIAASPVGFLLLVILIIIEFDNYDGYRILNYPNPSIRPPSQVNNWENPQFSIHRNTMERDQQTYI